MTFKMRGYSPFTKTDSPEKENKIKNYIKNNMKSFSDEDEQKKHDQKLMSQVNSMSDGETIYEWNEKTGEVKSYKR